MHVFDRVWACGERERERKKPTAVLLFLYYYFFLQCLSFAAHADILSGGGLVLSFVLLSQDSSVLLPGFNNVLPMKKRAVQIKEHY